MLLTIEKVIFLRSVAIFSKISDESIMEVVSVLVPQKLTAGQDVFKRGEIGNSLYIIESGKIHLHDEAKTDVKLGPSESFGLLAALDPEPRVVTATALEETSLLRIDGSALYELIGDSPEIAHGIIGSLVERLREKIRA